MLEPRSTSSPAPVQPMCAKMPDRRRAIESLGAACIAALVPRVAFAAGRPARQAPAEPGSFGGLLQTAEQIVSAIGEVRLQFALVAQQFGLHTHTYQVWKTGIERIKTDHDVPVTVMMCNGSPVTQTTGKTATIVPPTPANTIPLLVNIDSQDKLVALFPAFDHDVAGLAKAVTAFQQAYSKHTHPYDYNASGISAETIGGHSYRLAIPSGSASSPQTAEPNNVAALVGQQAPTAPYDGSAQQEYLDATSAFVAGLLGDVKKISSAMAAHAHAYEFNNFSPQPVLPKPYTITACVINDYEHLLTSVATVPKIAF